MFDALIPKIDSFEVDPSALTINQPITIRVSVSEVMATLYTLTTYSGMVYSGQAEVMQWQ